SGATCARRPVRVSSGLAAALPPSPTRRSSDLKPSGGYVERHHCALIGDRRLFRQSPDLTLNDALSPLVARGFFLLLKQFECSLKIRLGLSHPRLGARIAFHRRLLRTGRRSVGPRCSLLARKLHTSAGGRCQF